jgi:hypothetical protein
MKRAELGLLEVLGLLVHDVALNFALDKTVAVASVAVDVVEQVYNYLFFFF